MKRQDIKEARIKSAISNSTLLISVALLAVIFAWYVERTRFHVNICGVWYYPTPEVLLLGYKETLTIREDGSFTKVQQDRIGNETYDGVCSQLSDGSYSFHVQKRTDIGKMTSDIDKTYRCRCAIDKSGRLIFHVLNPDVSGRDDVWRNDCLLDWHCYTHASPEEQSEEAGKAIMEHMTSQSLKD